MKKILFIILVGLIIAIFGAMNTSDISISANSDDELSYFLEESILENNEVYQSSFTRTESYYSVFQNWTDLELIKSNNIYKVNSNEYFGGESTTIVDSFSYGTNTTKLQSEDSVSFDVSILNEGLYQIYLDYYIIPDVKISPVISLLINSESQFTEMNYLEFKVDWGIESDIHYDRFGDELTPKSFITEKWYLSMGLIDPNRFYTEPLYFYFDEGINNIDISVLEGSFLLGNTIIKSVEEETSTYDEYFQGLIPNGNSDSSIIVLEAEDYTYKSKQSIRSKYMRDPQVTPYEYQNRVLNVLDGYSFGESGDSITYTFSVPNNGLYNIAFKYYQNTNNGLISTRKIEIDNEVLFDELNSYHFEYSPKWKNEILSDNSNTPFSIYLSEGTHTISIIADNEEIRDIYHELIYLLEEMQDISRQINKITGGLEDKDRDWNITNYIPNLVSDLTGISNKLGIMIEELSIYIGEDDIPIISEIKIAKNMIAEFIDNPDDLPSYMSNFTKGESSAYGRINSSLPSLIYSPLNLDKMYIYNNHDLPKANSNFFVKTLEGLKAFIFTFFDPKYNEMSEVDEKTIEIWVNKSRLYVEIMQRMIDEEFTPDTGVKVQLSIMPDENKIILANAAGTTPDGVIGITFKKPFEFAIRDIIVDIRDYEGFYELAEEFNPNTFVPYIYSDGVYAIPETQDVKLLFYRKDIFAELGVEPPDTWDEVISLVPVLQKYDMNFYAPIGEENSYKGFDKTTPFIYQFGGTLYDQDTMSTTVNVDGAYKSFELMTELFSVYNLPVSTASFFQDFRNGTIPVGIGDANMYIQLKYAAPELSGQWGVLPIPGVENESSIVERWDPTYGGSSIIFEDSEKHKMTWELIKWWSSSNTQADFSYNIQSTLGDKFLYMTANIDGFKNGAWPNDSKYTILDQWDWIQTTGKVPGDYMVERELSNAWNKVVFEGLHPRIAIDEAKIIIDLEIKRKLIEFLYMNENGELLKPFLIPTIDNIENWVRKDEN